jgi:hypothetical protein
MRIARWPWNVVPVKKAVPLARRVECLGVWHRTDTLCELGSEAAGSETANHAPLPSG